MPAEMPPGTIAVICQQCGTRLFAAAGSAGRQAKCAKCGAITEVPAITVVRVTAPVVHAPPTAKPVAAAKPQAKAVPVAKPVPAPATAKPVHHAPAPAVAAMMRTQATKISQDTLAKFGKLAPPAQNGSPRSAADTWATPDGPVRVWGQLRTSGAPAGQDEGKTAAEKTGPAARAAAIASRVPARLRLPVGIAAAVLLVIVIGYVSYAALSGPGDGPGALGSNWTPLDYTTRAAASGKEPGGDSGDTKVLVRIKFDVRFSNLLGLSGDNWEVRDSSKDDRQQPYNVSFTLTDAAHRAGTLGFVVSGSWRPRDITMHAKQEDAWLPLDIASPKP